ncbi:MAG: hypothetical protein H7308_17765 [Chthonomonadaceae bacterium]|nr:hypothetical protein [Chthonomonadaceae bacterium]
MSNEWKILLGVSDGSAAASSCVSLPSPEAECYLILEGIARGPYLISQLRTMWNSGAITSNTLCTWSGREAPIPVRNLFTQKVTSASTSPSSFNFPLANRTQFMDRSSVIAMGGAFLILVGFFQPWIKLEFLGMQVSGSGYQIAQIMQMASDFTRQLGFFTHGDHTPPGALLYLLPLLAIASLICQFLGREQRALQIVTGLAPILLLVSVWMMIANEMPSYVRELSALFTVIGSGIWMTLLGAIVLIVVSLRPRFSERAERGTL